MLSRTLSTLAVLAFSLTLCASATAEPLDAAEKRLKDSGVALQRMKLAIVPDTKKKAKATTFSGWAVRADYLMVLLLSFDSAADAKAAPPHLKTWHTSLVYHSQIVQNGKDLMIIGTATPKEPKPGAKRAMAKLIKAFK